MLLLLLLSYSYSYLLFSYFNNPTQSQFSDDDPYLVIDIDSVDEEEQVKEVQDGVVTSAA